MGIKSTLSSTRRRHHVRVFYGLHVHVCIICCPAWSERNGSISPDDVPYGSKKLYWWHGSCGHEWQASAKARSSGENCPICSNARIVAGINDLASLKPELLKEWSPNNTIQPTEIGVGSHKKVLWIGACGHEWSAEIRNRVRGAGCPYCSHNAVLQGFNDLAQKNNGN